MLTKVLLENGDELESDIVVLGIGVNPSTDYIIDEEIHTDSKGFVIVDNCMKTNVENIGFPGRPRPAGQPACRPAGRTVGQNQAKGL